MTETLLAATVHPVIYGDSEPAWPTTNTYSYFIGPGPDKRHVLASDADAVLCCTVRDRARKTKRLITCLVGEVITL